MSVYWFIGRQGFSEEDLRSMADQIENPIYHHGHIMNVVAELRNAGFDVRSNSQPYPPPKEPIPYA